MNKRATIVRITLLAALLVSLGVSRFLVSVHADPGDGCSIVNDACVNNGSKCDSSHQCVSVNADDCRCMDKGEN
jgi:hypothetical protein